MEIVMLVVAPAGVLLLVGISWLAGGWRNATIASADAARTLLAEKDPAFAADRVLVASNGRAALLASAAGERVAAIVGVGDKLVVRQLAPGSIRAVAVRERPGQGSSLHIDTRDLACRRIELVVDSSADQGALASWVALLRRLQAPDRGHATTRPVPET